MPEPERAPAERLLTEIRALEGRDFQLWSLGFLVLLVVAVGFLALVLPNLVWGWSALRVDEHYLPQLFFGFFALIVLFNIYAFDRKRRLRRGREQLMRQLVSSQAIETPALRDPQTDLFNRRYFEMIAGKEVSRADRRESPFTILLADIEDFRLVNARFGVTAGDRVIADVAELLKGTFRNSDLIVRYGGDEFLVLLTDTCEEKAESALGRLLENVGRWNDSNGLRGYRLSLACGLAGYSKGVDVQRMIAIAKARIEDRKSAGARAGWVTANRLNAKAKDQQR